MDINDKELAQSYLKGKTKNKGQGYEVGIRRLHFYKIGVCGKRSSKIILLKRKRSDTYFRKKWALV